MPSLKNVMAFNRVFDIPVAPDPVSYKKGEKVIRQTVFPDNPEISEIPPLVINYFDPDSGQYRDYITAPVPLQVIPVKQFNFSDSELPDDIQLINRVIASDKGIWGHLWGQSVFNQQPLNDRHVRLLLVLFLLLPPLLLLIRLMPMLRDSWQERRRRSPLAQFRLQLQAGAEPLTLLGIYLSQRTGLSPARLNINEIRQQLSSLCITAVIIDELCDWLEQYQEQFTVSSGQRSQRSKELLSVVVQLDRQLPEWSGTETAGAFL